MPIGEERGRAARLFLYSSVFWLVFALAVGVLSTFQLFSPDSLRGLPDTLRALLTYGRLQPVFVNVVVFGWLSMAMIGLALYLAPRLTGTALRLDGAAFGAGWLLNAIVATGSAAIAVGFTQGREMAEYPWPLTLVWWLAFLVVAYVVLVNLRERRHKELHVTLWYVGGAFVWTLVIYFVGNGLWSPSATMIGIGDAILTGFYVHNLLGMWLGMMALGVAYYLASVFADRAVWSRKLAAVGFWPMAVLYPATGAYMLWEPMPGWLRSSAVLFAALLAVPMWAVVVNLLRTLEGRSRQVAAAPGGPFLIAGIVLFCVAWIMGMVQTLPAAGAVLQFTYWTASHTLIQVLGAFTFVALAGVYYAVPGLTGRAWYSDRLAGIHFRLTTASLVVLVAGLAWAGFVQGGMLAGGAAFQQSVAAVRLAFALQAAAVIVFLAAQCLFAYHLIKTLSAGRESIAIPGLPGTPREA